MNLNTNLFFKRYEKIRSQADGVFEKVKNQYPDCVKCKLECSDCCHALFDITLIEALYINHHFNKITSSNQKDMLLESANKADRHVYKLKKKAYKSFKSGESENKVLAEIAKERVACPLLSSNNCCEIYELRPITCRIYGIPTSIAGKGHTCGLSKFERGESYPTVNLDALQSKLLEISKEFIMNIQSKHLKMGEILVPLSMALLTTYDESYLGVSEENQGSDDKGR